MVLLLAKYGIQILLVVICTNNVYNISILINNIPYIFKFLLYYLQSRGGFKSTNLQIQMYSECVQN